MAQPLVTGYSNNLHRSCTTFAEAKDIMDKHGITTFWFLEGMTDGPKSRARTSYAASTEATYSVAKGRETGLYSSYILDVKPRTDKYNAACHKKLADPTLAENFLHTFEKTENLLRALSIE
ncbi:hypothetical protein F5Y16DRAFT_404655 [Xylariaceae sp. FL0255]|nr:hypothetical protein F5Y16DRAFT_404655 [Xylariaceae sp. FL0255]